MHTTVTQRWRSGRASYRPAGEVIDPRRYEVALCPALDAKRFVVEHHYSHSMPAPRHRVGLYRAGQLVGVAVFSHPMQDAVLDALPCPREQSVELGRFVLLDDVAANGETWFLARAFEVVRERGVCGVVSFSDPFPRYATDGRMVKPGHLGTIYRASNATYAGRSSATTLRLLPDGTVFSPRVIAKIRKFDRNWQSAARVLERHGAAELRETDDPRAWLARWLPALTRPYRHPGNLRYLFGLERAVRRRLPPSLPYPKIDVHREDGNRQVLLNLGMAA